MAKITSKDVRQTGAARIPVLNHNNETDAATDDLVSFAESATLPGHGMTELQIEEAVRARKEAVLSKHGMNESDFKSDQSRALMGVANVVAERQKRAYLNDPKGQLSPDRVRNAVLRGLGRAAKGAKVSSGRAEEFSRYKIGEAQNPPAGVDYAAAAEARHWRDIVDLAKEGRGGGHGGGRGDDEPRNTGSGGPTPKVASDPKMFRKWSVAKLGEVGLSPAAANRMLDRGFDASRLQPGDTIDAKKWGISRPTINHFAAKGYKIANPPEDGDRKFGYSEQELRRGRAAGVNTVTGSARLEARRGLFRNKVVYEDDGRGNPVGTPLAPRYGASTIGAAIKRGTTGAIRGSIEKRVEARESKRLRNPFYRISKTEALERDRDLVQLQGQIAHTGGVKRWYYRQRLKVAKMSLVTKGWMTFIVLLAVLFAPWVGLLTWSGWGLAAVAMTLFKMAAFVIINVYNLVADGIVSVINFVGNTFSGGLEAATGRILDFFGLSHEVCTGSVAHNNLECTSRLFAYTTSPVDTQLPGLPAFTQPTEFDTRPLIDIILAVMGIKFSVSNAIRSVIFGGK